LQRAQLFLAVGHHLNEPPGRLGRGQDGFTQLVDLSGQVSRTLLQLRDLRCSLRRSLGQSSPHFAKAFENFTFANGWQAWSTVTVPVTVMTTGTHVFRVVYDTAGTNLNWFSF